MRLKSLEVSGFRGFSETATFDLDADAVIVSGVNGSGKTSMFDAVLWALCGYIERLDDQSASLVSRYSRSGEARVKVVLRADDGSESTVIRRFDDRMHLTVQMGAAAPTSGPAADAALIDLLWPDANAAANPIDALTRSLTHATYLQQDAVRTFVEADDDRMRFDVVGELVGAGRIRELQAAVEASRQAWTRATTAMSKELEPIEAQRASIADRVARLAVTTESPDNQRAFTDWHRSVSAVLGASESIEQTPVSIDRAMLALQSREQAEARQIASLTRLSMHLEAAPPPAPDLEALQQEAVSAEAIRAQAAEALRAAQEQAAAIRRQQIEAAEQTERLQALARLALQNLDEVCPVCAQPYDVDGTRSRLEGLLAANDQPANPAPDISAAAAVLESAEARVAIAVQAASAANVASQREAEWRLELSALLEETGLSERDATREAIDEQISQINDRAAVLRELRSRAERLSLDLARVAESSLRGELSQRLNQISNEISGRRQVIEDRQRTRALGSAVLEALRAASNDAVTRQVQRIEPLLQRVFATVDPHPSLRVASFLTDTYRGHGTLWTELEDPAGEVNVRDPARVLSSSQLNVLAVAVFLSLNLAIPTLPLQVVALDDPLQSLDNVNLLGLSDLLRRVKSTRQVIVSTHDDRLAQLLERKLRPVSGDERTVRVDLHGWTPDGPMTSISEVPPDIAPLRLVATG